MSIDEIIQAKIYRLEELRKYQSYYGPNTPYPVIVEINDLETELRRLLSTKTSRPTGAAKRKAKKKDVPLWQIWRMSQTTIDAVATIAFIALVFLFGSIILAAYIQTRPADTAVTYSDQLVDSPPPTLRPTFTPTSNPNAPVLTAEEAAVTQGANLPSPGQAPTEVPTPVPSLTPSATPVPTAAPSPTETPVPTNTLPPPPTATPAPPTSTPAPIFPFVVVEQGNRMFQKTTYHVITIYAAAVSAGNIPIGGLKIVGDHNPSGAHAESGPSDWNWSVTNCLECGYVKQGNLKFEPGTFADGVWNIYLADQSGTQLSPVVPLVYSADPEKWVWDFIIFKKTSE